MLEIYKENLFDLLSLNKSDLKIKEAPNKGIYVEGLT
jgi:kinesin family protein 5